MGNELSSSSSLGRCDVLNSSLYDNILYFHKCEIVKDSLLTNVNFLRKIYENNKNGLFFNRNIDSRIFYFNKDNEYYEILKSQNILFLTIKYNRKIKEFLCVRRDNTIYLVGEIFYTNKNVYFYPPVINIVFTGWNHKIHSEFLKLDCFGLLNNIVLKFIAWYERSRKGLINLPYLPLTCILNILEFYLYNIAFCFPNCLYKTLFNSYHLKSKNYQEKWGELKECITHKGNCNKCKSINSYFVITEGGDIVCTRCMN